MQENFVHYFVRDINNLVALFQTYTCKFCQEAVGGGTYFLKLHLQKHLMVYTCKECAFSKKSYFSYADFSMHCKAIHVNHYCDYCQKNKLSKASLEKHIKFNHMKALCPVCKRYFTRYRHLTQHIASFHPELNQENGKNPEISYCVECDKQFGSYDLYKKHLDRTKRHNPAVVGTRKKLFNHMKALCPVCRRYFTRYKHLSQHIAAFHPELNQENGKNPEISYCVECDKQFRSYDLYKKHLDRTKTHNPAVVGTRKKLFNHMKALCPVCRRYFTRYQHLSQHIAAFHPELNQENGKNPEISYCVECDKQFGSYDLYKKHLAHTKRHNPAVGTRKKFVPCPDCGRIFTRTSYMRNHHKQVHKKQSEHYCRLCDKILFSAWSLKTHIAGVHMKVRLPKTKVCDICGRAFSTNAVLTKHRRTHTGERPYRCTHCPAAFTQGTPLKSHLRTQHKVF